MSEYDFETKPEPRLEALGALIVEPSKEWLDGLAMGEAGKFVAINDLILLSPPPLETALQWEIVAARTDLKDRIDQELAMAQKQGVGLLSSPYTHGVEVTDAGRFSVSQGDEEGFAKVVTLFGQSTDFGVGDRHRTATILKDKLDGIGVVVGSEF